MRSSSDIARSVEAARERLRRVRTEAEKALGPGAVEPPSGRDLLAERLDSTGGTALFLTASAAAAILIAVAMSPLVAAAFLAGMMGAGALLEVRRARRARRLRADMEAEIDGILARLESYVITRSARAREEAGTLDRAALQHSIREGMLLARLAAVPVTCPSCGALAAGTEFARRKGCPRCASGDALARPRDAAEGAGARALAEYALWANESRALAKAQETARRVADLARRAEREMRAGRAAARGAPPPPQPPSAHA